MCAFTFCWWACSESWEVGSPPSVILKSNEDAPVSSEEAERGKKEGRFPPCSAAAAVVVAGGVEEGEGLVGAVRNARALLESVLGSAPARGVTKAA